MLQQELRPPTWLLLGRLHNLITIKHNRELHGLHEGLMNRRTARALKEFEQLGDARSGPYDLILCWRSTLFPVGRISAESDRICGGKKKTTYSLGEKH